MRDLWELFLTFAKIGGFTFGGGYAMLPILQREVVDNKKWVTSEELMDYYAIGQCTPGIIAVNTATFIGYKRKGVAGGIVATLGCVFPSLIIIMVIAAFIHSFSDIAWVQHALAGIRVCVCVLVLCSILNLAQKAVVDAPTWIIFLAVAALSLFTNAASFVLVISAGVAGILVKSLSEARKAQNKEKGGQ